MRIGQGLRAALSGPPSVNYVAFSQTQTTVAGTTLVLNRPAGTNEGNLMLAIYCDDGAIGTWTPDTGWTEIIDHGVGTRPSFGIAYKIAGASEPSSYTFTSINSRRFGGAILTFGGAAYDVIGSVSLTETLSVQTAPAITLSSSGSGVIAVFVSGNGSKSWSNVSGGLVSAAADSDTTGPSYGIYYQTGLSAGSTGTKSATISSNAGNFAAILVGLKPS